jgi:hypothetical protein
VLQLGALTALGLAASGRPARGASFASPLLGRAKRCILLWLDGGPSHLETFDVKPDAPAEVRGPFAAIPSSIPGLALSELLPRTATLVDRIAIIRSMESPLGEHNLGAQYVLTGYPPSPSLAFPSFGAVQAFRAPPPPGGLPPYVAVPRANNAAGAGFLPARTAPFVTGGDPGRANFRLRDLDPFPGLDSVRLDRRRRFLADCEANLRAVDQADRAATLSPEQQAAFDLTSSPAARAAFRLEDEPDDLRDRYGRRSFGQSCLLARRLIEQGVSFVTAHYDGWDTHDSLVVRLKEGYAGAREGVGLVPTFDQAFSALIEDLDRRGLLDETLVLVLGEFGRTPKLNAAGGRDHWPRVFSVALAGAGIRGGTLLGRSDATGESPLERPVTPAELASCIYTLLGFGPDEELRTPDGRPIRVHPRPTTLLDELT